MLPTPTRRALLAFAGCAALFALGLVGRSPVLVVFAGCGLSGLAGALALTLPLANRMRRMRIEFAWWHGHGAEQLTTAVTAGAPYPIRCYVRNRSDVRFELRDLQPVLPAGTRCVRGGGQYVPVPSGSRVEFTLTFSSAAAGRMVAQGLSVNVPGPLRLFEAPLYFPAPLSVKVLPRAGAAQRTRALSFTGLPIERPGQTLLREHGGGSELRELRELQPGDPFKSIAWKASARRGKLLVREVDSEVQETLCIVLDVSGTMRGGAPGSRKLDMAIELAALKARDALERGDRVALYAVDGRIVSQVQAGEGRKHMLRIYDALLQVTEVVDADLTAIDRDALMRIVARYMRHQDGIELPTELQIEDLAFHARRTLRAEHDRSDVVADDASEATLRRYCRQRGIPLPYRGETRGMAKAAGLAAVLKRAGGDTRVPRSIVVVTDFDGLGSQADTERLQRTLRMLRRHHHALAFVWPDPRPAPAQQAEAEPLRAALLRSYGLQEERRAREAKLMLAKLGIPLVVARAFDPTAAVVTRVRALVQAA